MPLSLSSGYRALSVCSPADVQTNAWGAALRHIIIMVPQQRGTCAADSPRAAWSFEFEIAQVCTSDLPEAEREKIASLLRQGGVRSGLEGA